MSSFLNSVLSTISDRSAQVVPPPVRAPTNKPPATAADPKTVPIRSGTQPQLSNGTSMTGKRKADEALNGHIAKAPRKDLASHKVVLAPKEATKPSAKLRSLRHTAQLDTSVSTASSQNTTKNSPVAPGAEPKAPKKGSYAEIMARMKQATAPLAPVGTIKHKPKEVISAKKELLRLKQEKANKGRFHGKINGKFSRSAPGSKSNSPGPSSRFNGPALVKKPDPKELKPTTYQGTMKPKPETSYKGTMKPASQSTSAVKKKDYNSDDPGRRKSLPVARKVEPYRDYSDEESDGMDSFIEDDSDMEAGFTDVEEEEEKTLKLGKKEDKYEALMEAELKRQKEAKKKRLSALQAKHGV